MQSHTRGIALVVAVLLGGGDALTPVCATTSPQDAAIEALPEESPLSEAMGKMSDAKRAIREAVELGDSAAALTTLTDFQTHIVAAKAEAPPRAGKMPEAERTVFVAGFRAALIDFLRVTCDLELALMEGRLEHANVILHDKLGELEGAGHDNFGGDDEG